MQPEAHGPRVQSRPNEQPNSAHHWRLRRPLREAEDLRREGIPHEEIDIAIGEPVNHSPASIDQHQLIEGLKDKGAREHDPYRHLPQQPCDDIEDRQHMDEPERVGWLNEAEGPELQEIAGLGHHDVELHHRELERQPEGIEIDEVDNLAVEVIDKRPVD